MNWGIRNSKKKPVSFEEVKEGILDYLIYSKETSREASTSLPLETRLKDDLGMDSMDIVELVVHLEKKFNIDINQAEHIPQLDTLGALTEFTFQLANRE